MTALLIARHAHLWVLNKPAGVATHPGAPGAHPDLLALAKQLLDAPPQLAPINRLDLETSGVILCSDDAATRSRFGKLLAEHHIQKTYRALVYGHTHNKGVIRTPLQDARRQRPLDALTRWRRVEIFGVCSLLEVRPETGRKHQIRRHLQEIGHAIVGDARYPPRKRARLPQLPNRLWLHAASLQLELDGELLRFEAPLPEELEAQLVALRALRLERAATRAPAEALPASHQPADDDPPPRDAT